MASLDGFKSRLQATLRPAADRLARGGVTANQVVVAVVLLSFATGAVVVLFRHDDRVLFVLPTVILLRTALGAIGDLLTREHGQASPSGELFDELGDVFSDAALYLPLAAVPGFCPYLVAGFVVLAMIAEMAGVLGVVIGGSRRRDGPMGRGDRALVMGATAFLIAAGLTPGQWLHNHMGVLIALLLRTIHNRARRALREKAVGQAVPDVSPSGTA